MKTRLDILFTVRLLASAARFGKDMSNAYVCLVLAAVLLFGVNPLLSQTGGPSSETQVPAPETGDSGGGSVARPGAGSTAAPETDSESDAHSDSSAAAPSATGETGPTASEEQTTLNLLGGVDANSGESRRNENVQITLIDNNVLNELNRRMGTTATVVTEFKVEHSYFGAEFGGPPTSSLHLNDSIVSRVRGNIYASHNNSFLSARSFFQVGDVKPARTNDYGFGVGVPLWRGADIFLTGSQQRIRGSVNGNVLVLAPDERTPLATDPATRELVQQIIDAFPAELPNRTDINPRALNTNAPQEINNDIIGARLDQAWRDSDRFSFGYNFKTQKVDAFQLVNGQNPNTTTRSHDARVTWNRIWSAATILDGVPKTSTKTVTVPCG